MGGCGAKAIAKDIKGDAAAAAAAHPSRVDRGVAALHACVECKKHMVNACVENKKHMVASACTSCARGGNAGIIGPRPLPPMKEETARKWLVLKGRDEISKKENHYVRNRMICFHYAGGNSNVFKNWDLKDTEIVMVELPGRNARFSEKPMTDLVMIARKIAQALEVVGYLRSSVPLVFFGHSFGAMLATNVARILKKTKNYSPKHLIVSGCTPLHMRQGRMKYSVDNDDDLIESLLLMGGITREMANDKHTVSQFLPSLRADYLAVDNYVYQDDEALTCPMMALGGQEDFRVPAEEQVEWSKFTTGPFTHKIFPGGHFFIKPQQADVLEHLTKEVFSGQDEFKSKGLMIYDPVTGTMKSQ